SHRTEGLAARKLSLPGRECIISPGTPQTSFCGPTPYQMSESPMRVFFSLTLLSVLTLSARSAPAQDAHHEHAPGAHTGERLGVVSFPNSGARAAQQPFIRGLALLHSFEYDDARATLRAAEQADSSFAMAYWGEA